MKITITKKKKLNDSTNLNKVKFQSASCNEN